MYSKITCQISLVLALFNVFPHIANAKPASGAGHAIQVSVMDRTRVDAWQWFAAPPTTNSYGYVESLIRIGVGQNLHRWDWKLELSQPSILDVPGNAIGGGQGQGQLGLGATYYAVNSNSYPATAFFKQGYVDFHTKKTSLRLGRFEFVAGADAKPSDSTIAWLQHQRIAQRLLGSFGFSDAQRSFDGILLHSQLRRYHITALAARVDQGVFTMNGNPELDVDLQYLAVAEPVGKHILWRAFAIGYHDGRTGVLKTDNRSAALLKADRKNIRIGTYGGNFLATLPAGPGKFDFLFWGAGQNGSWGTLSQNSGTVAVEGGYQFSDVDTKPWLRGGWFRSTGDDNPTDKAHNTFFQLLPTPRIYARIPFYNLMNSTDTFVELMDQPAKRLALHSGLHWVKLTSPHDLWYLGGGAFNSKVSGYVGRSANGESSLSSVADVSVNWHTAKLLDLDFYYGFAQGKSVIHAIYPAGRNLQYGFVQLVYHWSRSYSSRSTE